jgi:ABC-type polar amino acid transport system ATPase subunit
MSRGDQGRRLAGAGQLWAERAGVSALVSGLDRGGGAVSRAAERLGRFSLGEKRADYPDQPSGGQQQRGAIPRTMAVRPRLMLLDEVTSTLARDSWPT